MSSAKFIYQTMKLYFSTANSNFVFKLIYNNQCIRIFVNFYISDQDEIWSDVILVAFFFYFFFFFITFIMMHNKFIENFKYYLKCVCICLVQYRWNSLGCCWRKLARIHTYHWKVFKVIKWNQFLVSERLIFFKLLLIFPCELIIKWWSIMIII